MSLRIKKNDMVVVLTGKYKGKKGKVISVMVDKNRAIVEGINYIHKSTRPNPANPKGGIVKREGTIDMSNLALYCPKCDKGVRYHTVVQGEDKKRVCVICGETL